MKIQDNLLVYPTAPGEVSYPSDNWCKLNLRSLTPLEDENEWSRLTQLNVDFGIKISGGKPREFSIETGGNFREKHECETSF